MSTKAVLKRSGFTLIELLVVIAIIGLLVSILIPSLSDAKWQAKVAKCQAGLHTVGLAMQAYMTTFGMDEPWPFNNGTEDGTTFSTWGSKGRANHVEGNGPGNPAEALMPSEMRADMNIPAEWSAPDFLETPDSLFCAADPDLDPNVDFNVWGGLKPGFNKSVWGSYPYLFPHVLKDNDPFHVTGMPTSYSRLAHKNGRDNIGAQSANLIMREGLGYYPHFNGLLLNGVVDNVASDKKSYATYLFSKGYWNYRGKTKLDPNNSNDRKWMD